MLVKRSVYGIPEVLCNRGFIMKGFVVSRLCILLLVDLTHSQFSPYDSLWNINPFREFCLAPCRLTCSVFSLGCSLPNCQVCVTSCETVCDTRDRFSFPNVFGLEGIFPFLSWLGQNGLAIFGSAFGNNKASYLQSSWSLLDLLLFSEKFVPHAPQTPAQQGNPLMDMLFGRQQVTQPTYSYYSVRNPPSAPSLDLLELVKTISHILALLLESIAKSLNEITAALTDELTEKFENVSSEIKREILHSSQFALGLIAPTPSNKSELVSH